MDTDKVSVIIPVFNSGPELSKAIESVITQEYSHIELIVIDGGSTDGTIDVLKKYQSYIHYCISERDEGIYDAMNKGASAATGTWLLFLGADDELCPKVISDIFSSFSLVDTDLVYGKVIIKNKRKQLGQQTNYGKLIGLNIPHQAIFYRKSVFQKFSGYNQRYKILADYDLNLKIFEDSSIHKIYIDKTISLFSGDGISKRTIDYAFFSEKKEYLINHCKVLRTDKRMAKYYFFIGVTLVLKQKYKVGALSILHAIIFSKKRFYYFSLTVDFILGMVGIRKKYKYV